MTSSLGGGVDGDDVGPHLAVAGRCGRRPGEALAARRLAEQARVDHAEGTVDVADASVAVAGSHAPPHGRCARCGRRCRPVRPTCTPTVLPARRVRRRRSRRRPGDRRLEKKQSLNAAQAERARQAVDGQVPRPQQRRVGGEAVVVAGAHRDDVIERGRVHDVGRRRHAPDQTDAELGGQRIEAALPRGRPVRARHAELATPNQYSEHPVLLDRAHTPPARIVEPSPEERRVDGLRRERVDPPLPRPRGTATAARCDGSG